MNIKSEKGFTGVDIAIAIIVIFIFTSIIATLFYNYSVSSEEIERKSQATYYAIAEIEKIKNNGFETYSKYNASTPVTEADGGYGYIQEDGKDTEYYKTVTVQDYTDIEGNENKVQGLVKKITVTIKYMIRGQEKQVDISTILSKES